MAAIGRRLVTLFGDIKIAHSIFALPFALTAALLAGGLGWLILLKVVLALFFARTSAMAFNRIVDARLDARNPRTSGRALPAGNVRIGEYLLFWALPTIGFVAVCASINSLCLILSPVALLVILGYSFTKRFTAASHFLLGLALAAAPIGTWIALRGSLEAIPLLLGGSVLFWTAGFDIIYSCLDVEFDRKENLSSIPALVGIGPGLRISAVCHLLAVAGLGAVWLLVPLGWVTLAGVIAIGLLLLYEHSIVRPGDLSRVGTAFFTVNGIVSVLFLGTVSIDIFFVWK